MEQVKRSWPGLFISFEGGDGVGKTTQIKRLANKLKQENYKVVLTREPGGSPGAEEVRRLMVDGDPDRWSPMSEALLVFAGRVNHLEKIILPALREGKVVITDRFFDSTMAYQGIAGCLGAQTVDTLRQLAIGDVCPDVTFILTLSSEEGLARAKARWNENSSVENSKDIGEEDRFEQKGKSFQADVHAAFAQIAKDNSSRCVAIDANRDVDSVSMAIYSALHKRVDMGAGFSNE